MPDVLSAHIYYNGPTAFTANQVLEQPELFAHRAALYYTPTENLPDEWVGTGHLDVRLPLPTPDYLEFQEIRAYAIPRLWVDLLQRATQKIRWTPMRRARVVITRFERTRLRDDHFGMGAKAARDALKFRTTGRADAIPLFYFGAIWDDDDVSSEFEYRQQPVSEMSDCGVRIQVSPAPNRNPTAG